MGFGTYITIQKTFGKKLNRTVGENMKALVLTDYYKFEYKDVPEPTCKDDEVVVNVKACAICGSDVHGYDGTSGRRQPPIIMGHEAAGVISAIGKNVTGYQVGDRVTFDSTVYCGKCWHCRRGEVNLCENRMVLGVACDDYRNPGAMAEYVTVPERSLYKIPDNVSFVQAAGVEPLSVALHALSMSKFHLGDHAAVVGAGTIGLLLTQLLKAAGASQITVIDIDEEKLNLAKRFGATTPHERQRQRRRYSVRGCWDICDDTNGNQLCPYRRQHCNGGKPGCKGGFAAAKMCDAANRSAGDLRIRWRIRCMSGVDRMRYGGY